MSAVQALNVLMPLFTFPYLIRAMGLDTFGVFNYLLAVSGFLVVLVDYGLTLTGTRDVATQKNDAAALSKLFSIKWSTQILLLLPAFLVLVVLYTLLPDRNIHFTIWLLVFLQVPANMLLPTWFLQGVQAFRTLAWLSFFNKAIYVVLVFSFINSADQLWLLLLFYVGCQFLAAVTGFLFVLYRYQLRFQLPGWGPVKQSLKQGWPVFISSLSVAIYTNSAMLILGFFAGDRSMGVFAAVEKVLLVFRLGLSTLFSVIYPKVSQLTTQGFGAISTFLRKIMTVLLLGLLLSIALLYLTAPQLVYLLTGKNDAAVLQLLYLLLPLPLFIGLNMPSYQMLLAAHQQQWYSRVMLVAAFMGVVLNSLLAAAWQEMGTGVSLLVAELVIALGLMWGTEKRYPELQIWKSKKST
ncbi:MAG: oligosaccharide flippase family protein [Sphingobacteriaceae bacterium]|nr:oligosaccharide flippase family protein [Sphingobacteriaceae bacterium]